MKRFRFRLERLLRVKRQRQRQAELRTAQVRANLDLVLQELELLDQILDQTADAIQRNADTRVASDLWLAQHQHALNVGRAIEQAEARKRQVLVSLQQAESARVRVSTEVEVLDHLRESHREQHGREVARKRQNWLDDLSLLRWRSPGMFESEQSPKGETEP